MQAEGELRSNLEESDRVRELQDKVADLKAEVSQRERELWSFS
jgi:ecotropic viral integration site 5 protein